MSITTDYSSVPFGPSGKVVFDRTYALTKPDGTKETWPETVQRVARGNITLVHGAPRGWSEDVFNEYMKLCGLMREFAIIPAGRQLAATGLPGRQHLMNCWVSGWGEKLSDHFEFTFMRLMEGGGVGANYSSKYLKKYGAPKRPVPVQVICRRDHPDIDEMENFRNEYITGFMPAYIEVEDTREGWADAVAYMIDMAMCDRTDYESIVFDVSKIRPSGSPLVSSGGTASGPGPLARMLKEVSRILGAAAYRQKGITTMDAMEIDHAIAEAVVAGGKRRSARMAICHWEDPGIMDFINCKQDTGKHWTTNISVEVDDAFFKSLKRGSKKASSVHEAVVKGMLNNGEPGYWHGDNARKYEDGEIIACNPCGEIALEAWEPCNLGHVNLDYFHDKPWEELEEAHRLMTRFLIRATYGDVNDPKSREVLDRNRRIGVGHMGVQGYWAKRGVRYTDIPGYARTELDMLYDVVWEEAHRYAGQLGIPVPAKLTTVAPTGSVAKLPGVSEGIHPIYARHFERRIRFSDRNASEANQVLEFADQGFVVEKDVYDKSGKTWVVVFPTEDVLVEQVRALGIDESVVQSADELSIDDMLAVQEVYQTYWADNAVSYTVNVPEGSVSEKELADILARRLPKLKGTTVMVDASRPQSPYTRITKEAYEAARAKRVEDSTDLECRSGACPIK